MPTQAQGNVALVPRLGGPLGERNLTSSKVEPAEPILIVDDDHSMRRLLAAALTLAGHRTVEAADATEALEQLRHRRFGAVLLDCRMPGMSGLELLVALRARPDTRTLPVILVTGDDEIGDRVQGLRAGADDYVVKPFHPDELVARVEAQLRGQAAWHENVERQLRERSAVAAALCRLTPESTLEGTAELVCNELRSLRELAGAAVVTFVGEGLAVPLAVYQLSAWGMQPTEPLPVPLGRYLEARAGDGPWIERPGGPGTAVAGVPARTQGGIERTVACAPLGRDGEVFGVLFVTTAATEREEDARTALSVAIDFAAITSNLLAPPGTNSLDHAYRVGVLDEILRQGAFSPVFQPIVELRGARVMGFEALTRFDDGIPPDTRFTEAAALDRGVELETATLLAALRASPELPNSAWLSLNVSPPLVLHGDVLHDVVRAAQRPLVLELTEHDPVEDYFALRAAVARLGEGVRLSVDDAGSGFASLRHVLALQPAFVKLDITWVRRIDEDPARQALVAGLVHFARQSGAVLIAEGIETNAELQALQDLAVDLGQGFLFGHPAPVTH
jgi:EAL domain-containing protein (putative c-di-GMP-specific phosphodiesterase class I)/DNA-binding response OmpR family regulator